MRVRTSSAHRTWTSHARVALLAIPLAALAAAPAAADNVAAGVDLFVTQPGTTYQDLSGTPIPAGFFGPGSDPFTGTINFVGVPIGPLGPTDTVVERKIPATLPSCGSEFTVPIEIVALSLTSVAPITVTYNGGFNPQQWTVDVTLSSVTRPQPPGTMTIRHTIQEGGTFDATLPVQPKLIFTNVTNPLDVRTLDTGGMLPPIQFSSKGFWLHNAPPFAIVTSPGGISYDNDRNPGTPDIIIKASSNFIAGLRGVLGSCTSTARGVGKTLTWEEALLAKHGILPPQSHPPQPDGREGSTCLLDGTCIITTPTMATALRGTYNGDNSFCAGDADHNGRDDRCAAGSLPGVPPWGSAALAITLLGSGLWFVMRRRTSTRPLA